MTEMYKVETLLRCESKNHKPQQNALNYIILSNVIVNSITVSKNGPVRSCILRGIVHSSQRTVHSWTSQFLFQTLGSHWRLAEPGRQGGHQTVATPLRWTQEPVEKKFFSPNNDCFVCVCVCGLWYPALQCSCGGEPGARLQTQNTKSFCLKLKF